MMGALLIHLASVAVLAIAVESACRLGRFRPAVVLTGAGEGRCAQPNDAT